LVHSIPELPDYPHRLVQQRGAVMELYPDCPEPAKELYLDAKMID